MCGNGGSKGYKQIEIVIVGLFFLWVVSCFRLCPVHKAFPLLVGSLFLMHAMFMPCLLSCCRSVFRDLPTATLLT